MKERNCGDGCNGCEECTDYGDSLTAEHPHPDTVTAEHHERVVREAVKAAYARAAYGCIDESPPIFPLSDNQALWLDGYEQGRLDCEAKIRAMGESGNG